MVLTPSHRHPIIKNGYHHTNIYHLLKFKKSKIHIVYALCWMG